MKLPEEYHEQIKQYDARSTLDLSYIRKELKRQKDLQLQEICNQEATEAAMMTQAKYTKTTANI